MLKWLLAGLVMVALAAGVALWSYQRALDQPLALQTEQLLNVPAGSAPGRVLGQLEQDGVLSNAFWLRLYWRLDLDSPAMHSGEYRLVPGQSARDLLHMWQRGEVVQYNLTLVEGWNFRQLRAALANSEVLEQTLNELSNADVMAKLGLEGVHPEGQFFPDTYRFVRGMSDEQLLKLAHARLKQVLDEEWAARAEQLPYRDAYEALIMASLIEKETGVPHERAEIAGVFVRRLRLGMRLQTDPTVIYGMGERYNGRITRADLRLPTPYNTYTIDRLPPTPIAMVGREAIHAALNPRDGKALYFVAKGDGSHVFSNTLEAHNRAVREYQLKRRADYRSSPAPRAADTE